MTYEQRVKHWFLRIVRSGDMRRPRTIDDVPADIRDDVQLALDVAERRNAKTVKQIGDAFAPLEVNGVLYGSPAKAKHVRDVLVRAGIGWHYPGSPEAKVALAAASGL